MSKVDRKVDAILLRTDIVVAYHVCQKIQLSCAQNENRSLYNNEK